MFGNYYKVIMAVVAAFCMVAPTPTNGNVLFLKENITVLVSPPDTVIVNGEYFFGNVDSNNIVTPLYYPFPIDTATNYPTLIIVKDARTGKPIEFDRSDQGINFQVKVKKGDTSRVTVNYKQHVLKPQGRYILTTTSAWERPLDDSRYSVSVPRETTLAYLSYACDSVEVTSKNLIYHFFRTNFMPDRDLIFTWTKRPQ